MWGRQLADREERSDEWDDLCFGLESLIQPLTLVVGGDSSPHARAQTSTQQRGEGGEGWRDRGILLSLSPPLSLERRGMEERQGGEEEIYSGSCYPERGHVGGSVPLLTRMDPQS